MENKRKKSRPGDRLKKPRWELSSMPEVVRNYYREHLAVSRRNESVIEEFRKNRDIHVKGRNVLKPIFKLEESNFPSYILEHLKNSNIIDPTAIQCQAWPIALAGRDLVAVAETGSGKTLGYILPGIVHISYQPLLAPDEGPIIVILVPTRELAIQVHSVCEMFLSGSSMNCVCIYGGVPKKPQIRLLEKGAEMIVATPGRLLDFLEFRQITLKRCTYLVLDEADRMLDLGMAVYMNKIIEQIRPDRQILMWTATWPEEVQSMAEIALKDYILIMIGDSNLSSNRRIRQIIDVCKEEDKIGKINQLLLEILSEREDNKVLVFCDTKRRVEYLTRHLREEDWPAMCIHGDKEQLEREWVMQDFRSGDAPILVATDVASRGLDIKNVKYVINYDFPNSVENYVHRIGRTARANSTGTAYTFLTDFHSKFVIPLIDVLREANHKPTPDLLRMADKFSIERYGRRYNSGELTISEQKPNNTPYKLTPLESKRVKIDTNSKVTTVLQINSTNTTANSSIDKATSEGTYGYYTPEGGIVYYYQPSEGSIVQNTPPPPTATTTHYTKGTGLQYSTT
ncbi:ATP-dependent RNA helicase DDX5 isoform X2-like [Oopsacas minuta]|uniref:RNA helicase n=1 Tax=Oopsacas minuta TaxID=111878 RepID=A0AAV7KI94_9METZ|nr:ATP-dependent RNA helicase DDX5 isoform X2-like [Oopsacas minuta]